MIPNDTVPDGRNPASSLDAQAEPNGLWPAMSDSAKPYPSDADRLRNCIGSCSRLSGGVMVAIASLEPVPKDVASSSVVESQAETPGGALMLPPRNWAFCSRMRAASSS